jgi:hypothetical protein
VSAFKKFSLIEELTQQFGPDRVATPWLYRAVAGEIAADGIDKLFERLSPQVSAAWPSIRDRTYSSLRFQHSTVQILIDELEAAVSHVMNFQGMESETGPKSQLTDLLCPDLVMVSGFVSFAPPASIRRMNRLVMSMVHLCKESTGVENRQKIISFLPEVIRNDRFFARRTLRVPSAKQALIEHAKPFLEKNNDIFPSEIVIRFRDSPAEGDGGPRAQWLSVLFEHYFRAGNGIFEYSDDSQRFLKPAKNASFKHLSAVGRLLGISIRHGVTVGARLTPCALALLRLPEDDFDIEACVEAEDPAFFSNIKKVEQLFSWEDQEAAEMVLQSLPDSEQLTQLNFYEYEYNKLFQKGIGSIRKQMAYISRALQSVLPQSALELFSKSEFEAIVNGVVSLSAETLWRGLYLKKRLGTSSQVLDEWLEEIIEEESDEFRFKLHRFITGVPQPPLKQDEPWLFAEVDFTMSRDKLPIAQTCFKNIVFPDYASKSILRDKLALAISEGNGSLDLY